MCFGRTNKRHEIFFHRMQNPAIKVLDLALLLAIMAFFLGTPVLVWGQEATFPQSRLSLLNEVWRSRDILQEQITQEQKEKGRKPKVVSRRDAPLEMTLAVYHEDIGFTEQWKVRKEVRRIIPLTPIAYQIRLVRDNGVNSEFEIMDAPLLHVIAVRYPILKEIGTAKKPKFELQDVVYAPYSDFLVTPEIVRAGKEYLDTNVEAVYAELKNLGARSHAFKDRLLVDIIPPAVVKSIIAIEHMSGGTILTGDGEKFLNMFYTILATNKHEAYAYAKSAQSASGLVQFIPRTYKNIVELRPDLSLPKDFNYAMADPFMAIKAEIGFLDNNLMLLLIVLRVKNGHDPKLTGKYLATM